MIDEPITPGLINVPFNSDWLKSAQEKVMKDQLEKIDEESKVTHPYHYNASGIECRYCQESIECMDVVSKFNFHLGNVIKYIWRHEHKNGIEDLKKAQYYLNDYIERLENEWVFKED